MMQKRIKKRPWRVEPHTSAIQMFHDYYTGKGAGGQGPALSKGQGVDRHGRAAA